jgi:hypothetical protein
MKSTLFLISATIMFGVFAVIPNVVNLICDKFMPTTYNLETICIVSIIGAATGIIFIGAFTSFSNDS